MQLVTESAPYGLLFSRRCSPCCSARNSTRTSLRHRFSLLAPINWADPVAREALKVVKLKVREGMIDRVVDERTIIGRDLFAKGSDMALFVGKTVELQRGVIEGAFGQGGKFKAYFKDGLAASAGGTSAPAALPATKLQHHHQHQHQQRAAMQTASEGVHAI